VSEAPPGTQEPGQTESTPVACSLGASDLQQRLDEIAALGAGSLIGHEVEAGRHRLRFRTSEATRQRLEAIVVAERSCCSFLDLALTERDGALLLEIGAASEGQATADALAAAFAPPA
jgi:hypothetical protein